MHYLWEWFGGSALETPFSQRLHFQRHLLPGTPCRPKWSNGFIPSDSCRRCSAGLGLPDWGSFRCLLVVPRSQYGIGVGLTFGRLPIAAELF